MNDMHLATDTDAVATDSFFEVVRHDRRRRALSALGAGGESTSVESLSRDIAAMEEGAASASDEPVREIRISLRHCHLPKLADAGLVSYDRERGVVTPTAALYRVRTQLASLDTRPALE